MLRRTWPPLILAVICLSGCDNRNAQDHFLSAQQYRDRGETTSAVIELKNTLQKDPSHVAARFELGSIYLDSGDYASALRELERALDLGMTGDLLEARILSAKLGLGRYSEVLGALESRENLTPALLSLRGQAALMGGDDDRARQMLEEALRADPTLSDAYVGLARIAQRSGDLQLAASLIDRGFDHAQPNRSLWITKGEIAEQRTLLDDARDAYREASQFAGPDQAPKLGLIRVMLTQGDLDNARTLLSEELRRDPTSPGFNFYMGSLELSVGDVDAAEHAFRNVQARMPNHLPTLFMMGATQYQLGHYAQAIDQLQRYVARVPRNVVARELLAASHLTRQEPGQAVDALSPVADLIADQKGHELLGTAYLQLGDYARATPHLEQAAALSDVPTALSERLAASLLGAGQTSAAVVELQKAIDLSDDPDRAAIMLTNLHLRNGQLDQAEQVSSSFLQRSPDNPAANDAVAVVALARGDKSRATEALQRALEVDPDYAPAAIRLAEIAKSSGDVDAAEQRYQSVLEHDPGNLVALVNLANLALKAGEPAMAIQHLQTARAANPSALGVRVDITKLAMTLGRTDLASEVAGEALEIAPDDAGALHAAALVAVETGDEAGASTLLPRLQNAVDRASPDPTMIAEVGDLWRRAGHPAQAQKNLGRAIDAGVDSPQVELRFVETAIRNDDAQASRKGLNLVKARGVLSESQTAMLEGDVFVLEGKDTDAVAAYQIAITDGQAPAVLPMAGALERSQGVAAAIEFLRKSVASDPQVDALKRLGELEFKTNDLANATTTFEALVRLRPTDPEALNNLAWVYHAAGDARAASVAEQAYEVAPNNPDIADTYAWILIQTEGDVSLATRMLEAAATADDGNATTRYHLAEAYAAADRFDDSAEVLRGLLNEDFPEHAEARALLDRVETAAR